VSVLDCDCLSWILSHPLGCFCSYLFSNISYCLQRRALFRLPISHLFLWENSTNIQRQLFLLQALSSGIRLVRPAELTYSSTSGFGATSSQQWRILLSFLLARRFYDSFAIGILEWPCIALIRRILERSNSTGLWVSFVQQRSKSLKIQLNDSHQQQKHILMRLSTRSSSPAQGS
jgi:hypothetical protein